MPEGRVREREVEEKKKSGSTESLWEWYIAILHHKESVSSTEMQLKLILDETTGSVSIISILLQHICM